ncbi:MAG: SRPBCC family protein [Candidatus Wallbacteria bacterium]|nr:SRPBCC family protein [Candidatus Wallbacteria bacterium]
MAQATEQTIVRVSLKDFYSVISDYGRYPEFVDGMTECSILERKKTGCKVKFVLDLIKRVDYTIQTVEKPGKSLEWTLLESNLLKKNNGSWFLKALGAEETEVTYSLEVGFGLFVPGFIMDQMTKQMLPKMLASFVDRAETLFPANGASKKRK